MHESASHTMPERAVQLDYKDILVVDDEPAVRAILREGLEGEGYSVAEAGTIADLYACLDSCQVGLITLDLNLACEDGLQVVRQIRAKHNVPIIMITGKGAPVDRVTGLEQGADDYIVKPFHIREVLLRIEAVMTRYKLQAAAMDGSAPSGSRTRESYECSIGRLDVPRRELRAVNGELIELTSLEFNLLLMFLRYPSRILSRDDMASILKGRPWSPEDRSIDGYVARLRRKIDSQDETPRLIKSVRGVGYVFTDDVKRLY